MSSSSLDYLYFTFFFLVGPEPPNEIAFSSFLRSPYNRAETFSLRYVPFTPGISLTASALLYNFLTLAFSCVVVFILLRSCTRQTFLSTVPPLALPIHTCTFSQLRYPILFQLALFFFPLTHSPINYGWGLRSLACYSLYSAI